jgi:enterochelin esterase-like enzyme
LGLPRRPNEFLLRQRDGHKQVASNITAELVPFIDANYKTLATRENRALEGFSMGGFGAGLYAATNPNLFSATVLSAPGVPDWANLVKKQPAVALEMYNNVQANFTPYSIWDQTAANAPAIAATVDYKLLVGDADSQLKGDLLFRDFLISKGIDPKFELLPGLNHTQALYLQQGSMLSFLNQHFLAARTAAPLAAMRAVPEPTSAALIAIALTAPARRRRAAHLA